MPTCDIQDLLDRANCFSCLTRGQLDMIQLQLVCEILANGGGGSGTGGVYCGLDGDKAATAPTQTCAIYYATDTKNLYYWDDVLAIWS